MLLSEIWFSFILLPLCFCNRIMLALYNDGVAFHFLLDLEQVYITWEIAVKSW